MTDETKKVPFEGKASDKAVLLLAAAEELGLDPSVVQTRAGHFLVPAEVEKKAFASRDDDKPAAKKTAAKKTTAKKPE